MHQNSFSSRRQTQSLEFRMTGPDLFLGFRDLAAASRDSCGDSQPLDLHLLEGATVNLQDRLAASEVLPALDDHIDVLRIEFHSVTRAPGEFGGDEGCV